MEKSVFFAIFLIFDIIFGISALSVLIASVYLIIKLEFNQYIIIILIIGLIMALISILGIFCKNKKKLLIVYMILISIIFLIEISLALIFKFSSNLQDFIKNHIKDVIDINDNMKDKIVNLAFIILCSASACCLLSFLSSLFYYLRITYKQKKYKEEPKDMFKGLDYTNLNPNATTMIN